MTLVAPHAGLTQPITVAKPITVPKPITIPKPITVTWVPVAPTAPATAPRCYWRGLVRPAVLVARLLAVAVIAVAGWRLGVRTVLPVLVGVAPAEFLVAWLGGHVRWGYTTFDNPQVLRLHVRAHGYSALAALVPSLLLAAALVAAAGRLPQVHEALLRAAIGVLLANGYALLLLLAAARRLVIGVAVAGAAALSLALTGTGLPTAAALLVLAWIGLLAAAPAALDPRSYR
jgi:hypothetical protein